MNITSCPQCGGRVRSVSIGWKCEGCNGFIDISGQFYEHKDESFMPPMTNADRIRAMSNEKLAILLCISDDALDGIAVSCVAHFANEKVGPRIELDDDIDLNYTKSTTEQWERYFEED